MGLLVKSPRMTGSKRILPVGLLFPCVYLFHHPTKLSTYYFAIRARKYSVLLMSVQPSGIHEGQPCSPLRMWGSSRRFLPHTFTTNIGEPPPPACLFKSVGTTGLFPLPLPPSLREAVGAETEEPCVARPSSAETEPPRKRETTAREMMYLFIVLCVFYLVFY